jgi:hypothetical protein
MIQIECRARVCINQVVQVDQEDQEDQVDQVDLVDMVDMEAHHRDLEVSSVN